VPKISDTIRSGSRHSGGTDRPRRRAADRSRSLSRCRPLLVHLHTNLFARAGGANRCRLQRQTTSPIIQARPGARGQRERLREWSPPRCRESRVAARRALDIRSPIMSSVNNHCAARTHAGLRTMLTAAFARGKTWRQKYLPSGDVYT